MSVFQQSERWRCQYSSAYVRQSRDKSSRTVRFERLVVKVVTQNEGDFVDVILL